TSVSLSVAHSALVYGQSETLTALVTTPSGDPTPNSADGTVTFYAGPTVLGSATALGSATLSGSPAIATLSTTALTGGSDVITARYSGDSSFAARSTGFLPTGREPPVPVTEMIDPVAVAVDGADDVFIADVQNNQVLEVKPGAAPITIAS